MDKEEMTDEERDLFETFKQLGSKAKYLLLLQVHSALEIEKTAHCQYDLVSEQAGKTA
ncbi:hypothetical protein Holit_01600 [Hollandina sp. SP2]